MISSIVIVVGSALIAWISRRSLLHPASHGFARFFAFEAILVLVVLNAPHWFTDPLGVRQLVSWLLLIASAVLVAWGVVLLRHRGRPRPASGRTPRPPADGTLVFGWENTQRLVTTGLYRYIRHPMYASLLYLTWGALLKSVSLGSFALAIVATIAVFATAKLEEAENIARFGGEYRDYMARTRRFVPFLL